MFISGEEVVVRFQVSKVAYRELKGWQTIICEGGKKVQGNYALSFWQLQRVYGCQGKGQGGRWQKEKKKNVSTVSRFFCQSGICHCLIAYP
ncbi:hypothetical protein QG37_07404 [Candidozyma auris]|uniref:Uncharacterized protein n=1 Tax=Candidozyma auris TaxID=498019 RepID=A0A0L0NQ38_CANAR|nr:hypothetical protein QG37_07404 [[Candida] auris]